MLAVEKTVIRREQDNGILKLSACPQRIDQPPNQVINRAQRLESMPVLAIQKKVINPRQRRPVSRLTRLKPGGLVAHVRFVE